MNITSRREFFKKLIIYSSAGAVVQVVARNFGFAQGKQEEPKLIDMTQTKRKDAVNKECVGIATGLTYVEDLDKALKAKDKKINRKPGENCASCMFYDYQKNGKPTCQLIPKCLVHANGSCNSWVKKA